MVQSHAFTPPENAEKYHQMLDGLFSARADQKTADWFTNYLKGVICYRGLKTPMLKEVLKAFFKQSQAESWPSDIQLAHIRYWLSKPMAEDKLTAILWLEIWLKNHLKTQDNTPYIDQALSMLEACFEAGDIHDWSTNDWCCVRILELIPEKAPTFIPRLISWQVSTSLWQRRSAILAFKKVAKNGSYHAEIATLIGNLLPSNERFVQTGIGWVLADASRKYPDWAALQFDTYFNLLNHEVIVRHAKYLAHYDALKQRSKERRT